MRGFRESRRYISILPRLRLNQSPDTPGQFTLKGLHRPNDWKPIAASCIQKCLSLADQVRSHTPRRDASLLQLFDDLSDELCSVLDVAELCRNVHPDPDFVNAAHNAFVEVSTVVQELNADETLYEPLLNLYMDNTDGLHGNFLSHEESVMVKSLKNDFERGGIALGTKEKRHLLALQEESAHLGDRFVSASPLSPPCVSIPETKLRNIPRNVLLSAIRSKQDGYLNLQVDSNTSHVLLKWLTDSKTREKVYRAAHMDQAEEKLNVLGQLAHCRYGIAQLLGYESYSQLVFGDRLASSPEDVFQFLEKLSQRVAPSAGRDRVAIEVEKLRREPVTRGIKNPRVHGWDRSYYIGRLKAERFDISSTEISNYLPLSACLEGLAHILREVFNVNMTKADPSPGETWHRDVQKMDIIDESGEILGQIFLDLHPRRGKYSHAAHFSIRCGRRPSSQSSYQIPVVALVCNFGKQAPNGENVLSMSEFETLFHEFGHSLHSILSRTKYQHLSGTRVATDLVEVPSHLFEHFAWDPRVVSKIAKHYRTGDPMPTRMVRSFCASRTAFMATDIQMQLLFAAMDLQLHGKHPPKENIVQIFGELQSRITSYPPDHDIPVPATFHHFVGYGAGYYSYIFARVISAQLWASLFEKDPFSREGGLNFRSNILAHGGAEDPAYMLFKTLGCDVSCDPFLKASGIAGEDWQLGLTLPLSAPR